MPDAETNQTTNILQLDQHELLTNMVLLHDPFTITSIFNSQTSALQAAMDSSITNEHGTFGWIISTTDEARLITCQGNVYGRASTSYCTESYRLLSLL